MSIRIYKDLDEYTLAAEIRGRLEALRSGATRTESAAEFRVLERSATQSLGPEHGVVYECVKSRLVAESRRASVARTVDELRKLRERCITHTPDHPVLKDIETQVVRFTRLAGDPNWESHYTQLVIDRVREFGESSIKASIARANLAVALRGAGENLHQPEENRISYLRRAFELARDEWAFRQREFGDDDIFTWRAAAVYVRTALSAQHSSHPLVAPEQLLGNAADVVQARQAMHGNTHRSTLTSRIAHAEALVLAGQARKAVWLLHVAHAEADEVGLDDPHALPMALALAHLRHGTEEARHQAQHYRAIAAELLDETYGPDSAQSAWMEFVLDQ